MPAASRLAVCTATVTLICVIALFSFAYKVRLHLTTDWVVTSSFWLYLSIMQQLLQATTRDAKSISEDMLQSISNRFGMSCFVILDVLMYHVQY